jgi:hypothetical protein
MGATAAAVVTGVVTAPLAIKAAVGGDAVLLARVEQSTDLYDRWACMWERAHKHRAAIEALPDCPGFSDYRARDAFLKARDYLKYWREANELGEPLGALTNAIFETPAQTVEGVLAKIRILYVARGDYDGVGNDYECFQDDKNGSWFSSVIADLERLAGEVRS